MANAVWLSPLSPFLAALIRLGWAWTLALTEMLVASEPEKNVLIPKDAKTPLLSWLKLMVLPILVEEIASFPLATAALTPLTALKLAASELSVVSEGAPL